MNVPEKESETSNDSPETHSATQEILVDLAEPGQRFVLCQGGAGGKGNTHFKSSRNRVPRQFSEGDPGDEGDFLLELRMIADVGLVGYPNAGKSTLLGRLSAAHPKSPPYPFTTLNPVVGAAEFADHQRPTGAGLPVLLEGARRIAGQGPHFLRSRAS